MNQSGIPYVDTLPARIIPVSYLCHARTGADIQGVLEFTTPDDPTTLQLYEFPPANTVAGGKYLMMAQLFAVVHVYTYACTHARTTSTKPNPVNTTADPYELMTRITASVGKWLGALLPLDATYTGKYIAYRTSIDPAIVFALGADRFSLFTPELGRRTIQCARVGTVDDCVRVATRLRQWPPIIDKFAGGVREPYAHACECCAMPVEHAQNTHECGTRWCSEECQQRDAPRHVCAHRHVRVRAIHAHKWIGMYIGVADVPLVNPQRDLDILKRVHESDLTDPRAQLQMRDAPALVASNMARVVGRDRYEAYFAASMQLYDKLRVPMTPVVETLTIADIFADEKLERLASANEGTK